MRSCSVVAHYGRPVPRFITVALCRRSALALFVAFNTVTLHRRSELNSLHSTARALLALH